MSPDTIFALSSGAPPAGVAVVRASGPGARAALAALAGDVPAPRLASVRAIRNAAGEVLDRGLVVYFPAPKSYTGEEVAEFHLHGGRAVFAAVMEALAALPGFRAAEPGEFTRRAFLNGRMDLTEAEGIADLIAAETEAQRRQALTQAGGALARLYEGWRTELVRARALIEAELDFPDEDDVPGAVSAQVWPDLAQLGQEIGRHLADRRGERIREGAEIVVLGPPNAGKSSLVNALARRDVAIVSEEPGTTRDMIEVRLDLAGYAATLVDTAGIRDAAGLVEAEGVRRAIARSEAADMVLMLAEAGAYGAHERAGHTPPMLAIGTKADLLDPAEREQAERKFDLLISVKTGEGLDALIDRLAGVLAETFAPGESPLVTRARHRSALAACLDALGAALAATDAPLELRAEDLRRATDALGRLTGRVGAEDLLDVIFRDFCIGK